LERDLAGQDVEVRMKEQLSGSSCQHSRFFA
jgi:hypothetical protein